VWYGIKTSLSPRLQSLCYNNKQKPDQLLSLALIRLAQSLLLTLGRGINVEYWWKAFSFPESSALIIITKIAPKRLSFICLFGSFLLLKNSHRKKDKI